MKKRINNLAIALCLVSGGLIAGSLPAQAADEGLSVSIAASTCGQVWSGSIARLRIYNQPASTGKRVFAYRTPGYNTDYVGNSDDPNVVNALFLARDNGRVITGYTNTSCTIEWLDY